MTGRFYRYTLIWSSPDYDQSILIEKWSYLRSNPYYISSKSVGATTDFTQTELY